MLNPQHDRTVFSRNLPTPTNLMNDVSIELALTQEYGITTTLLLSKNLSPMIVHRKPNGRLRVLLDLR